MDKINKNEEEKKRKRLELRICSLRNILKKKSKKAFTSRQNYTPDVFERALADIKNGMSQRKASEIYEIPLTTINNALKGVSKSHKLGRQPKLTEEIEKIFVQLLIKLGETGVGLNKYEIFNVVKRYLIKNNMQHLFPNATPSDKWYHCFLTRHPELSIRVAQNLASCRAKGITLEIAEQWYNSVAALYNECWPDGNIPSTHLWNNDESGYSGDQGNVKVVVKKGILLLKNLL